ncbi:tyrosine-type recombinase/integrase [Sphaerisporangium sp. NPDC049003]|uniref:tyrosine-type recombinase/integrase n=1 Tax=Sphaerisporangium sp. NPDC049003 TaxID=3364517 RepID=UPI003714D9C3
MTARRSRGDGGLHWDEARQRWIATASLGFDARGKRITKKASGKTKTEAKEKLKEIIRDHEDGLASVPAGYTMAEAVKYWLTYGLSGRAGTTIEMYTTYAQTHIIPELGARKLRELTAEDVDKWLAPKSSTLSTRSLKILHGIMNRAVSNAQKRDKVRRNVVALCEVPEGRAGRPSKALTLDQAEAVLTAAEGTSIHAYLVLSLLIGARTEELRALTWSHVDLDGKPDVTPAIPPHIMVWRSVRLSGDTKTRKSRRTLAMPARCVDALRAHKERQEIARQAAGGKWRENDLVFASQVGTELDAHNVRRVFRKVIEKAGLNPQEWTPRETRHSFVSLLSDSGIPLENISRLVGHSSTLVTETVYRKQLRPVMQEGATAMDLIFPRRASEG